MDNLLIVIGGATGSGKTALAIALAKKYPNLVILSADSRQIYKRLDIGSAKVGVAGQIDWLTGQFEPCFIEQGVPQLLIDIAEPGQTYTLAEYIKEAERLIRAAWKIGKIPVLVGGTGLYLQSVAEGYSPSTEPDLQLRAKLEELSLNDLHERLAEVGGTIVATDSQNRRRVIRAIERALNKCYDKFISAPVSQPLTKNVREFVITPTWQSQRDLAPAMVCERLELGLVDEIKKLLADGLDKEWLKSMGLSYRLVIQMLDGEFSESELEQKMINEFRHLMRRQRTWFANRMPNAEKLSAEEIMDEIEVIERNVMMKQSGA